MNEGRVGSGLVVVRVGEPISLSLGNGVPGNDGIKYSQRNVEHTNTRLSNSRSAQHRKIVMFLNLTPGRRTRTENVAANQSLPLSVRGTMDGIGTGPTGMMGPLAVFDL